MYRLWFPVHFMISNNQLSIILTVSWLLPAYMHSVFDQYKLNCVHINCNRTCRSMHTVLSVLQTSLLPARKCQQFISGHHGPSSVHYYVIIRQHDIIIIIIQNGGEKWVCAMQDYTWRGSREEVLSVFT